MLKPMNIEESAIRLLGEWYYTVKPFIPRRIQIQIRRQVARHVSERGRHGWPISEEAGAQPPSWPGWPKGKRFALVLTHDVELDFGVSRCEQLADLEEDRGFHSAFGFVPLRYLTPDSLRGGLVRRGFEIMVHDLYHDGKLFRNERIFAERLGPINAFLKEWGTRGFSSGAMHHDLPWISQLDIDYSSSTYDVDPFEPQSCGVCRIFPYWVQAPSGEGRNFVELPYTLPQDFTLFVLLGEETNAIWRQKLDWIAEKGGMALIKTHPDYMAFRGKDERMDRYPVELYTDFLDYARTRYGGEYWLAQPSEVSHYWRGLQPPAVAGANTILAAETFCASCKRAQAKGWLSHYPRCAAGSLGLVG